MVCPMCKNRWAPEMTEENYPFLDASEREAEQKRLFSLNTIEVCEECDESIELY